MGGIFSTPDDEPPSVSPPTELRIGMLGDTKFSVSAMKNPSNVTILRDDLRPAGTKGRFARDTILWEPELQDKDVYVYASNPYGWAQIALALGVSQVNAAHHGAKPAARVVIVLTDLHGAEYVHEIDSNIRAALSYGCVSYRALYVDDHETMHFDDLGDTYASVSRNLRTLIASDTVGPGPWTSDVDKRVHAFVAGMSNAVLVRNAINYPTMRDGILALAKNVFSALEPFHEVWICVGSGSVIRTVSEANQRATFVGVGLTDQQDIGPEVIGKSTQPVKYPGSLHDPSYDPPPFPSALYYDAKVWPLLIDYARNNPRLRILFWNGAGHQPREE